MTEPVPKSLTEAEFQQLLHIALCHGDDDDNGPKGDRRKSFDNDKDVSAATAAAAAAAVAADQRKDAATGATGTAGPWSSNTASSPTATTTQAPARRPFKKARSSSSSATEATTTTTTTCSECAICLDDFEHGQRLVRLPRCRHFFHRDCIHPWLTERQGCCPLCRASVIIDSNHHGGAHADNDSAEEHFRAIAVGLNELHNRLSDLRQRLSVRNEIVARIQRHALETETDGR